MRIKISKSIPPKYHEEIRRIALQGFKGIGHAGVEIHVKAKGGTAWQRLEREHWNRTGGLHTTLSFEASMARAAADDKRHQEQFTGRAYGGVPGVANVAATTKRLITLSIPPNLDDVAYPRTWRYPRMKTAPLFTFAGWREELLHLVAHEAHHVAQARRRGGKQSEIRCERWAQKKLEEWRLGHESTAT